MDDAPVPPGVRAGGHARFSVAVIGLGSIGGVAAGCLCAAERHEVIACVRQPLERLTLERPEGTVEVEMRSITDPAAAAPVDWVLLSGAEAELALQQAAAVAQQGASCLLCYEADWRCCHRLRVGEILVERHGFALQHLSVT